MSQQTGEADPRRWLALALLGSAFFMVILDGTIVYVALPEIADDLGFSASGLQWVMSAYLLCFGGLLLLGGRTADLRGRRRVFMVGVGLFVSSSLLCGLAWSPAVLVGARAVQGVSAAIMAPTALSLLMTVFPEGPERNKALGIWGGIGGIGGTAGLLIGGPVTEALGWEWIFFINIPVGLAILAFTPRLLPESVDPGCPRCFDIAGAATVTGALVLLIYGISGAPEAGWTAPQTLAALAAAACLLALFVLIETRSSGPLVPLRIFRSRALVGGNLVLFALGMLAFGMPFMLTQYAQGVLHWSPLHFGVASVVMPVTAAIGSVTGQALATKGHLRSIAAAGLALTGLGCLYLSQVSVDGSYLGDIFIGLLLFGPGLGSAYVAGTIASLAGVAEADAGLASGLNNSSFQIGGAVGVAILSTVAVSEAHGAAPLVPLTNGFQAAFATAILFAVVGLLAAIALLGKLRAPVSAAEPAAAAVD
jgi:EmrB/QacA subfamily drug resistance transporter